MAWRAAHARGSPWIGAATLVLLAFALRDPTSRRPGILPVWPLLPSSFCLGALASAHLDRALTKGLFDPSHVTTSRVLEPFYADDTLYQRGSFALVGVVVLVCLGWLLSRRDIRGQRQTG